MVIKPLKRRAIGAVAGALCLSALLAQTAIAAAPPTTPSMTGEMLTGGPPTYRYVAHCDPNGNGYIVFAVYGLSSPPYAGTFFEAGTITFAATATPGLHHPTFAAAFQINSVVPRATIRGTKYQDFPSQSAFCSEHIGYGLPSSYRATIERQDESYRDSGIAHLTIFPETYPGPHPFTERFVSTNPGELTPAGEGDGNQPSAASLAEATGSISLVSPE